MCSMFAAWGSRTEGADLFSGRNLDWNQNTGWAYYGDILPLSHHSAGINKYKAVTVWAPNDGAIPHAVTGCVPLLRMSPR